MYACTVHTARSTTKSNCHKAALQRRVFVLKKTKKSWTSRLLRCLLYYGLVWLGLTWLGLAWLGSARLGLAWLGLAWLGLAWLGLAWLGSARLGLAWLVLTWPWLAWLGLGLSCSPQTHTVADSYKYIHQPAFLARAKLVFFS